MELFKQELIQLIPQLRRYANALVKNTEIADDLVQDCLERVLSKHHLWDSSRPMKPWVLTVLHNIFANHARQYKRTPHLISINEVEEITDHKTTTDYYLRDLESALDKLTADHREILLLIGLEEMSYKETATILDIPVGTVMSRLTRARQKLRQIMNEPSTERVAQ